MSDRDVERWRQRGEVFLWRYRDRPRNYPGWHLSADPAGAGSLLALLRLMSDARYSSAQVVAISEPTPRVLSVPNYGRGSDAWQSAGRWQLRCTKAAASANEWKLAFTGSGLQLSVGERYLLALIGGVEDLAAGRGDYAISGEEADDHDCLWIWWWNGA